MATVAIVGAGFMGSAMAWPLADNGHAVRLVGTPLDAEIIRQCRTAGRHPRLGRPVAPSTGSWRLSSRPDGRIHPAAPEGCAWPQAAPSSPAASSR
ncbi:MAG: 3-hydroxyacyl-CoA dehydrogenase NAD-binding domain-containing protein [Candidatus Methylomirabilales bacterium]